MAHNGLPKTYRGDEEAGRSDQRDKRLKCFLYSFLFVVFQTAVILVFVLVVMKVRAPKFRLRSATFDNFQVSTLNTNASFNIMMNAEFGVKNANFGAYKYQNSTIEFFYENIKVGEALVPKGKAKIRSTRKLLVVVNLSSANVPGVELGNEFLKHAWIPLSSQSTLHGKVELMKVIKKKKPTNMYCTMNINISSKELQDLKCI